MKATGIVRRIDELGRVVIPKEIRRTQRIRRGDPLEIFTTGDGEVIFKKYSPVGELSSVTTQYVDALSKSFALTAFVCDRDRILAASGAGRRDLVDRSVSQPLEKLMDSLLQAFGIATGFMLALLCVGGNYVDVTRTGTAWIILQLIAAAGGTLGFCLMYNLKTKYIWIPMIGGFLCWSIYLLLQALGTNAFVSALAAAFAVGVYGEIFARIVKVPTTLLFMPACIPLIPGGHLYYSALAVLASEWSVFEAHLVLLIQCAVGIAVGLAIVVELEKLILKISETKKQRRGKNK